MSEIPQQQSHVVRTQTHQHTQNEQSRLRVGQHARLSLFGLPCQRNGRERKNRQDNGQQEFAICFSLQPQPGRCSNLFSGVAQGEYLFNNNNNMTTFSSTLRPVFAVGPSLLVPPAAVTSRRGRQPSTVRDKLSRRKTRPVHVKKPLNAFMLFMKEMRSKVVDECTLKESAAINQILGRKVLDSSDRTTLCYWQEMTQSKGDVRRTTKSADFCGRG